MRLHQVDECTPRVQLYRKRPAATVLGRTRRGVHNTRRCNQAHLPYLDEEYLALYRCGHSQGPGLSPVGGVSGSGGAVGSVGSVGAVGAVGAVGSVGSVRDRPWKRHGLLRARSRSDDVREREREHSVVPDHSHFGVCSSTVPHLVVPHLAVAFVSCDVRMDCGALSPPLACSSCAGGVRAERTSWACAFGMRCVLCCGDPTRAQSTLCQRARGLLAGPRLNFEWQAASDVYYVVE